MSTIGLFLFPYVHTCETYTCDARVRSYGRTTPFKISFYTTVLRIIVFIVFTSPLFSRSWLWLSSSKDWYTFISLGSLSKKNFYDGVSEK